ncbi:hypothetical protein WI41_10980 [Burkholderia latens]|uniref:Uncharacterized protein n=1 Tax=Burkholderia latens TaxID=488446 RepID=A0AAP1CBP1_9BURK|nr:hypothetical protein WI41_10980 [Burkholderia latens]
MSLHGVVRPHGITLENGALPFGAVQCSERRALRFNQKPCRRQCTGTKVAVVTGNITRGDRYGCHRITAFTAARSFYVDSAAYTHLDIAAQLQRKQGFAYGRAAYLKASREIALGRQARSDRKLA